MINFECLIKTTQSDGKWIYIVNLYLYQNIKKIRRNQRLAEMYKKCEMRVSANSFVDLTFVCVRERKEREREILWVTRISAQPLISAYILVRESPVYTRVFFTGNLIRISFSHPRRARPSSRTHNFVCKA